MVDVVVVGQVGRDLVLTVPQVPAAGGAVDVTDRHELLGGAVNQAVGCRQLGLRTAVLGVVGDDAAGQDAIEQARSDGLDVTELRIRAGGTTALFVDVVADDGTRRLLEHVPAEVRLTADDVRRARPLLRSARAVLVQAAQPTDAVRETLRTCRDAGGLVVLDGAPADGSAADELVALADVVRADAAEAPAVLGRRPDGVAATREAARALVSRALASRAPVAGEGAGPRIVALAVPGEGDLLAYRDERGAVGDVLLPLLGTAPADVTGAGDAFVAGLVAALLQGLDEETAGWWAAAAAGHTVARVGGRPDLDAARVASSADRARRGSG